MLYYSSAKLVNSAAIVVVLMLGAVAMVCLTV